MTKNYESWWMLPCGVLLALVVGAGCQQVNRPGEASTAEPVQPGEPVIATETAFTAATVGDAEPAPATPVPAVALDAKELEAGWISLFDGQTLYGWQAGSQADWRVEDGAIVVSSGEKGLLYTTSQFSDYELKLEFRCPAATNSGIFLHTPPQPEDPAKDCYELNIAGPDNPFPTGSLVGRQKAEGTFTSEDWAAYEVTVDGGSVVVKLNGKQVLAYTDPAPLRRGHIGLQLNQGQVAFRKIRLRPLGLASIFNGQDLSGWKIYPDMPSRFTVTPEGWLNVQNGRGQLESEGLYGDLILQFECITHAAQLNSGVFFRCIPGEQMNGYECQIHNGTRDGDRRRPMDCGTGGFFRRQDARFVVADDLQWFHLTLLADGPHMAAWVNGLQVSDWIDERAADPNPRKGLRLEAGTLMIQGHDPTTDLSFRNLRAAELARRP